MATIQCLPTRKLTYEAHSKLPKIAPLTFINEAYAWARKQADSMKNPPKRVRLKELEDFIFKYDNHVSLFKTENKIVLLRVYWPGKNVARYSEVVNFTEASKKNPELVGFLLRNGEYAYLKATNQKDLLYKIYRTK